MLRVIIKKIAQILFMEEISTQPNKVNLDKKTNPITVIMLKIRKKRRERGRRRRRKKRRKEERAVEAAGRMIRTTATVTLSSPSLPHPRQTRTFP